MDKDMVMAGGFSFAFSVGWMINEIVFHKPANVAIQLSAGYIVIMLLALIYSKMGE